MISGTKPSRRPTAPPGFPLHPHPALRDGTRRWVLIGLGGWTALLAISLADIGFQWMGQGRALSESWAGVLRLSLLWVGTGALLSVGIFPLLGRLVHPELRLGARLGRYAAVGVLFLVTWSGIQAVLLPWATGVDPVEMTLASRMAWVAAGMAFNGTLIYAAMSGIHAAAQNAAVAHRQERRGTELRRELERARTSALSARLNPHFLFNTLHVASGLMARDPEGSRQVLADLRGLLAQALERDDRTLVPLEDELRLVEGYMRIQRARFGDRLEVDFQLSPEVRSVLVPPLLLQPLVENAVQHGIALAPAGGTVRIVAERRGHRVHLEVEDTGSVGPGRLPSPGAAPPPLVEQVGLGGVRARLGMIFGGAAAAGFTPLPAGGFRATLSFPQVDSQTRHEREISESVPGPTHLAAHHAR